jgi:hypothetical protein
MDTVTLKTSTIFVSVGQQTHVYRSIDEIPDSLRRKLIQNTTGSNSATILIADRRGKDELVRAIQGLPSSIPLRVTEEARRKRERREKIQRINARRHWLEIVLIAVLGFLLWAVAFWK